MQAAGQVLTWAAFVTANRSCAPSSRPRGWARSWRRAHERGVRAARAQSPKSCKPTRQRSARRVLLSVTLRATAGVAERLVLAGGGSRPQSVARKVRLADRLAPLGRRQHGNRQRRGEHMFEQAFQVGAGRGQLGAVARSALGPKQRRGHRRGRRCAAAAPRHGKSRRAGRGRARRRARGRHRAASLSWRAAVSDRARWPAPKKRPLVAGAEWLAEHAVEGAAVARCVDRVQRPLLQVADATTPAQAFAAAKLASRIERGLAPLAALAEESLLPAARDTAERTRRTRRAKRPLAQQAEQLARSAQQHASIFPGMVPPGQG
jgi:hypothetical protein